MQKINSPSFFIGKDSEDLISFGSGQPDLPPPDEVFDVLPTYRDFKYGLVAGMLKLREEIAKQYLNASADNFIITNGASEALDLSLRALYVPGGKVLLPRPYYYSYPFNVKFAGMESVFYDLEKGKINFDNFKNNLDEVRAIVINSPSNPTGTIQDIETLKKIEKIAQEKNIYIISDEVYKDLIYERENYLIQGDHVLTINSFSKTYAMCGFRVGYVYVREKELVQKIVEIKTHTSMNTNILGQEMAVAAMRVPDIFLEDQVEIWKKRRDIIYNGLKDLGLDLWNPEGAFYVFPKMKNSNKVVNDLYYKYKVIVYDGDWFGSPDRVRLSYALSEEKIIEGLKRIKNYLNKEYLNN
jgi:aspartate/methionine/tyrosine aminotransferase